MCKALLIFGDYADYSRIQSSAVPVPPNYTDDPESTVLQSLLLNLRWFQNMLDERFLQAFWKLT